MPADEAPGPDSPIRTVYVHAPFCSRRCFYCDFAVHVRGTGGAEEWLEALAGELAYLKSEGLFGLADSLDSVFVGGGTPSLLGPQALHGLRGLLGAHRLQSPVFEWTVEANPESFTQEVAAGWTEAGVNRVSLGVQTFHEPSLRWMGRLHGPQGAVAAVARAWDAGFENISVDLIFGLPAQLDRPWADDLRRAVDLGVPHVSLYGLTAEPGTPLGRAVREGREAVADEEQYRDEYLLAADVLTGAGFEHYEVSNFARPGHASRHNRAYWDGTAYLGLGNGAHSYRHPDRRWNLRDWEEYRAAAAGGGSPVHDQETLDANAAQLERTWLGLRTDKGVSEDGLGETARALVVTWIREGWAVRDNGRIRLTAAGWLLLDRLAVELDGAGAA